MDAQISDAVRGYQLNAQRWKNRHYVVHEIRDPDVHPSAPPRAERWKSEKTPIGKGGSGKVFLQTCVDGARELTLRAVKFIPYMNEDGKRRYWRELETLVKFSHDKYANHFVRMLGWYDWDSHLCIAMEYFPEGDLQTYLDEHPPLDENEGKQVISQTLQGLSIMHTSGIAHRDIKPSNILIHQRPTPTVSQLWWIKIADFGISKRTDPALTSPSDIVGTWDYMAPELLDHRNQEIDYRAADIWSVGCLAYCILTKSRHYLDRRLSTHDGEMEANFLPSNLEISQSCREFLEYSVQRDCDKRLKWEDAISHSWVAQVQSDPMTLLSTHLESSSSSSSASSSSDEDEVEYTNLATRRLDTVTRGNHGGTHPENNKSEESTKASKISPLGTPTTLFQIAAAEGNYEVVKWFLDKDTNIDHYGETPLHFAIENGHIEVAKLLLDHKVSVNAQGSSGPGTPLHVAASSGSFQAVSLLLDRGAKVTLANHKGELPLHFAAAAGRVDVMDALIDRGSNPSALDKEGNTPLHLALANGHLEAFHSLLRRGVDTHARLSDGRAPIHTAAAKGYAEVLNLLIDRESDPSAPDQNEYTPLHIAVENNHLEAVRSLLNRGADTDICLKDGRTAIHIAARNGSCEIVKLLADNKANVNTADNDGATPAVVAARQGHAAVIKLLAEVKADLSIPDKYHDTALHAASRGGQRDIAEALIEGSADIQALNKIGTPLHEATSNKKKEIVELLILKGADLSMPDQAGNTPLHVAVERGHREIAQLLVHEGAKMSSANRTGNTPLHIAVEKKLKDMVQLLVDGKAKSSVENGRRLTPLHIAVMNGSKQIVQVLIDGGANLLQMGPSVSDFFQMAHKSRHVDILRLLYDEYALALVKGGKVKPPAHLVLTFPSPSWRLSRLECSVSPGSAPKEVHTLGDKHSHDLRMSLIRNESKRWFTVLHSGTYGTASTLAAMCFVHAGVGKQNMDRLVFLGAVPQETRTNIEPSNICVVKKDCYGDPETDTYRFTMHDSATNMRQPYEVEWKLVNYTKDMDYPLKYELQISGSQAKSIHPIATVVLGRKTLTRSLTMALNTSPQLEPRAAALVILTAWALLWDPPSDSKANAKKGDPNRSTWESLGRNSSS